MSVTCLTSVPGRTCVRSHARRASRRVTATESAILAAACLFVSAAALAPSARPAQRPPRTTTVLVRANESLWTIASRHPCPGNTTAETVETIRALNGLDSAPLRAGRVLRVPAGEADGVVAAR